MRHPIADPLLTRTIPGNLDATEAVEHTFGCRVHPSHISVHFPLVVESILPHLCGGEHGR